ncbi:MAG: hypothetical protein IPN76_29415 [Saprospiraceae bacterium]|nr:hypothetical protein [Saprospiraceae bacterium]
MALVREGLAEISLNEGCLATGLRFLPDGSLLIGGMSGMDEREDFVGVRLIGNGSPRSGIRCGGTPRPTMIKPTTVPIPCWPCLMANCCSPVYHSGMASMARYTVWGQREAPLVERQCRYH